jgi:hypothetical protein
VVYVARTASIFSARQSTTYRREHHYVDLISRSFSSPASFLWPTLQEFDIGGLAIAPSGKWYWTGDPAAVECGSTRGYGSDADLYPWRESDDSGTDNDSDGGAIRNGLRPMHKWRVKPDWDMLGPLLVDMARAVRRMPNLQRGCRYLANGSIGNVCVQGAAPGFRYADFDRYEPQRFRTCRFYVGTNKDRKTWLTLAQIPDEVRAAWRGWLGDHGEMETGAYWHTPPQVIVT